jgi:hypothetical protein
MTTRCTSTAQRYVAASLAWSKRAHKGGGRFPSEGSPREGTDRNYAGFGAISSSALCISAT